MCLVDYFYPIFIINKQLANPFHWLLHRLDKFNHLISDNVGLIWTNLSTIHKKIYLYIKKKRKSHGD